MIFFYNVKPIIWIVNLLSILIVVNLEIVKSNKNVLLIVADDLGVIFFVMAFVVKKFHTSFLLYQVGQT